jgi:hypothetical protein
VYQYYSNDAYNHVHFCRIFEEFVAGLKYIHSKNMSRKYLFLYLFVFSVLIFDSHI